MPWSKYIIGGHIQVGSKNHQLLKYDFGTLFMVHDKLKVAIKHESTAFDKI
jgi:hypothetical protein